MQQNLGTETMTPDEMEAFTTATIIQKGNPNASQLH